MIRLFGLSFLELRRYRRSDLGRSAIVAVILLPLLYGTVYLIAFWNPYDNLASVPAAIVNSDKPAKLQGQTVQAGKDLKDGLVAGKSLSWNVTTDAEAEQGLETGKYYYVIKIPENFSGSIASLGSKNPKIAVLSLTTNDANSFLTSLVGDSVASQMQSQLGQTIIQQFVETTLNGISTIRSNLETAATGSAKLAGGTKTLSSGSKQVASGAKQVASGDAELASAADVARGYAQDAERRSDQLVATAAKFARANPGDELAADLLAAARRVNGVIDDVADKIIATSRKIDQLGAGAQELATGARKLSVGAAKINSGAQQLAKGLNSGVGQIPNWSPGQATNLANHVSAPVAVKQVTLNNTGTYGAGFAPYFMAMALWVALLIVFMLLEPVPGRVLLAPRMSALGVTLVGFIPVVIVTVAQVVVLLTVIHFGLDISPPLWAYGSLFVFLALVAGTYAAIIQLLGAVFGVAGRLVALVLLMLQLCSSGGTYPIQMSPVFFRTISPYLPMTYAITGIRHLLVGGQVGPVIKSVVVLMAILLIALSLSVLHVATHRKLKVIDIKPEISM